MKSKLGVGAVGVLVIWVFIFPSSNVRAEIQADYPFLGNLASDVLGAPALVDLGNNNEFTTAMVDGQPSSVFSFEFGTGLRLATEGLIPDGAVYSIVMLFEFSMAEHPTAKILDFDDLALDSGLYRHLNNLAFWTAFWPGNGDPFVGTTFVQVVLTRDSGANVKGYVDGVELMSFVDTGELALISDDNLLHFVSSP